MNSCKICKNSSGNTVHIAREMMFGFRDQFEYLECAQCGCVQLLNVPQNMARYYPENYYSFENHGWAKTLLRHRWSAYAYGRFSFPGAIVSRVFFPNRAMMSVKRLGPALEARILDVGCGSGRLLLDLQYLGFQCLAGVDPFLKKELAYPGGLTVHKRQLDQLTGQYDLIMLHHSFEHMDNPSSVMRALVGLLSPKGTVILRIPVASSYGWRHFGVDWINLDAPRHLFLHTQTSIKLLAETAGLVIKQIVHEGDDGVFWASEAYAQDIPMSDPRFPFNSLPKRLAGWRRLCDFRSRAEELNRKGQAVQVCFYLGRPNSPEIRQ